MPDMTMQGLRVASLASSRGKRPLVSARGANSAWKWKAAAGGTESLVQMFQALPDLYSQVPSSELLPIRNGKCYELHTTSAPSAPPFTKHLYVLQARAQKDHTQGG